jgi:DNA-binding IscR family transcriptional regulator
MRKTRDPLLQIADAVEKRESVFTPIWKETEEAIAKVLDKINFEDIANKAKSVEGAMVYQI